MNYEEQTTNRIAHELLCRLRRPEELQFIDRDSKLELTQLIAVSLPCYVPPGARTTLPKKVM
jgi:hypothetical protein